MVLYLRRFAFGNIGLRGSGVVLGRVRRFPLFFFEIVMHLMDTAPNDFRF